MITPSLEEAVKMLRQAERMNPGPWVQHSLSAAENAKIIAEKCGDMDSESAYVFGLLHDIGRREGALHMRHIFDGYKYLHELGYEDAATICLTHSFPIKDMSTYFGTINCSQEEINFLQRRFESIEFTDYDRLIQLCDAISMPQGAVILEKRFVDVAIRHGLPEFTIRKWQAFTNLKQYFDAKTKMNIYTFLPNIVENSFL